MSLDIRTETSSRMANCDDGEFQRIAAEFVESITRNFREYVRLVITSGTFAYGGATKGKSDVDILVVCEEGITNLSRKDLFDWLTSFIEDYIGIHKRHDYCSDTTFPGEYITTSNVEDALAGRGFHVTEDDALHLPMASDDYYMKDPERWYRAWRSALAFGKCLHGSEEEFAEMKNQAWEMIILFVLLQNDLTSVSSSTLFDVMIDPENKWNGIGITAKYKSFRDDERVYVESVLLRLSANGFLTLSDDGSYTPNMTKIKEWEAEVVKRLKDGSIKKASFLLTLEEMQELAKLATSKTLNQ
ncbi:hypothetical protein HYV56_00220 [Candidatus Peregrinibacteria bacterium]|nr:hypothetical protein [Candidatus Peregrinibacteria bacterium]